MPSNRQVQRPPSIPKAPSLPKGPRWEQRLRKQAKLVTGPGQPPPGFVTGTTSSVEWVFYWALFKALAPDRDPRQPPFFGADGLFRYQKAFDQGRQIGGQVIDFVVFPNQKSRFQIAIRLQTVQFHQNAPQRQQSMDQMRKVRLASFMGIVDVWDYELLEENGGAGDGSKAVVRAKQAVGLIEFPSRSSTGNARSVRYR
jgi:hypothetical protein